MKNVVILNRSRSTVQDRIKADEAFMVFLILSFINKPTPTLVSLLVKYINTLRSKTLQRR